jgi:hypothetical protein
MFKRNIAVLLVLMSFFKTHSQTFEGTFIIMASCRDGIIIGGDSRMGFYFLNQDKRTNPPDAYADSMQKIFMGKGYLMGVFGSGTIGDNTLTDVAVQFNSSITKVDSLKELGLKWYSFFQTNFSKNLRDYENTTAFFARYENGLPNLMVVNKATSRHLIRKFLRPDSSYFDNKYSPDSSCLAMKKIISKAIYEYAKTNNVEYVIGGPLYFIKLSKDNTMEWLGNSPPSQYRTFQDLWRAYQSNPKKIICTSKQGEKNMLLWLQGQKIK